MREDTLPEGALEPPGAERRGRTPFQREHSPADTLSLDFQPPELLR